MKISRNWLQTFFDKELPDVTALAEALTFHAFEIESIQDVRVRNSHIDHVLDVKVTPNRGHDALSHRAIALELAAILGIPAKGDPLRQPITLEPKTEAVAVSIENPELCRRFTGAYIRNIKVGPSPEWLRERLEAIGQRSINNVVDATNFVMFNIGQPLHAFDAGKLSAKDKTYSLVIRKAKDEEKMLGLDDKEYKLTGAMLAIADGNTGEAVSIAGIKGGKQTGVDVRTTNIILEAANWDGVMIRKTSAALKLRTDASERFQQVISPELAAHGIRAAADLIVEIAGGEIVGFIDEYPMPQGKQEAAVSTGHVNHVLGTELSADDVGNALTRLGLPHTQEGDHFTVTVPFERLDLIIAEDLIEEVARILGYDKIPSVELPPCAEKPEINPNFYAAEQSREELVSIGYSEVYTSVFADKGERAVANKVDSVHPYLRANLTDGLRQAFERNDRTKYLLGLQEVKLFEIGTVWRGGKELVMVGMADKSGVTEKPHEPRSSSGYDDLPVSQTERYQSFSRYPFIVRDISMWVPQGAEAVSAVLQIFSEYSQGLLRHVDLFDQFKKEDRISYAFHLVFQSFEKTLTDAEANAIMENIYTAVKAKGWEVR